MVAIDFDTLGILSNFAVTISCDDGPVDITSIDVNVDDWHENLINFTKFDLTFVDGSQDVVRMSR